MRTSRQIEALALIKAIDLIFYLHIALFICFALK